MTHKQRLFVKALASGQEIEQAAEISGYNLKYARRKASEPAIQIVVEKLRDAGEHLPKQTQEIDRLTPKEILWGLIEDPLTDDSQRIAAIRALIMYDRANPEQKSDPPTIIDDIPNCKNCPYSGKEE